VRRHVHAAALRLVEQLLLRVTFDVNATVRRTRSIRAALLGPRVRRTALILRLPVVADFLE